MLRLLSPFPRLRHSIPLTSRRTRMRPLGSLVLVGFTRGCSDFFSRLSLFCVDSHASYNHECNVNRTIFLIFIIFLRCIYPKPRKPNTCISRTPCTIHIANFKWEIRIAVQIPNQGRCIAPLKKKIDESPQIATFNGRIAAVALEVMERGLTLNGGYMRSIFIAQLSG